MKNIIALIGSPKANRGSSGAIADCMTEILKTPVIQYRALDIINSPDWNKVESDILQADILLFVFPMYVDSLPATLLEIMFRLEKGIKNSSDNLPKVYAICNCGFYDSPQTATALSIMQNYCQKTGLLWQYGIGIGCGGMIGEKSKNIAPHGPLAIIFEALTQLSRDISENSSVAKDNIFITPKIPRFLYRFAANRNWKVLAHGNAVKL